MEMGSREQLFQSGAKDTIYSDHGCFVMAIDPSEFSPMEREFP
jgi:hypothetical protein